MIATELAIRTISIVLDLPLESEPKMSPTKVNSSTVRAFFEAENFIVFSVTQTATTRWQANVRGSSPMMAFSTAAKFASQYKGHEVRLLIG